MQNINIHTKSQHKATTPVYKTCTISKKGQKTTQHKAPQKIKNATQSNGYNITTQRILYIAKYNINAKNFCKYIFLCIILVPPNL
jgi:hypothetical protein